MRALKIVGLVVAGLVGLVVLGLIAIVLLVDPNDYRDDIAQLVEQKTGRPLAIRGELGLKVFPWIALDVHDVTLGNPPGYGGEPFLAVQRASVGVKLIPLLHKKVEVSRVRLDGLTATLVSRSDTDNNWKDLGGEESEAPEQGTPAETSIGGLDVANATLVYRDEAKHSVTRLTGLEIHTGALSGERPVDAEVRFDYDEGTGPAIAQVAIKARAQLRDDGGRLEVRDLDASGKWFGAAESPADGRDAPPKRAEPLSFSIRSAALAVDLDAGTLAPATLDVKLGELPLEVTARGEKLFDDYIVDGKVVIAKTSARELMKSFGIEPPVTSDPKALSVFALQSQYRLTPTRLEVPTLDLTLDDTRVTGSAAIADLDTSALRFDLAVNGIDLDRYLAPAAEDSGASGGSAPQAAAKPPTELPVEALRELDARGQLRIARATYSGLAFTDIRLPLEAKGGRVHLGPTQAKLYDGRYDGDIVLDARPAQATLSLNEHVRAVDLGALMKAGFDTTRIAGKGNANARLTATGNTDAALFKSLAGKIDFDVRNGAIVGLDLWYEIRRALALFKRQAPPERAAGAPKTAFNALSGSAVIDQGVLRNDDLIADMTYLKVKGQGTLALTSQAVDYRLVAEVYKLPASEEAALADLKAAEIPVTITGTLADMKVRPDVEGYLKARVQKKVDEKLEKEKESLKKKLNEKLKGLFNH